MITLTESLQIALNESNVLRVNKSDVIDKMREDQTIYMRANDPNVKSKLPGPYNASISYIKDKWYVLINCDQSESFSVKDDSSVKTIQDLFSLINTSDEAKKHKVSLDINDTEYCSKTGRGKYGNKVMMWQYADVDYYSMKKHPDHYPPIEIDK